MLYQTVTLATAIFVLLSMKYSTKPTCTPQNNKDRSGQKDQGYDCDPDVSATTVVKVKQQSDPLIPLPSVTLQRKTPKQDIYTEHTTHRQTCLAEGKEASIESTSTSALDNEITELKSFTKTLPIDTPSPNDNDRDLCHDNKTYIEPFNKELSENSSSPKSEFESKEVEEASDMVQTLHDLDRNCEAGNISEKGVEDPLNKVFFQPSAKAKGISKDDPHRKEQEFSGAKGDGEGETISEFGKNQSRVDNASESSLNQTQTNSSSPRRPQTLPSLSPRKTGWV